MWITLTEHDSHQKLDANMGAVPYQKDYVSAAFGTCGTVLVMRDGVTICVRESRAEIRALMKME